MSWLECETAGVGTKKSMVKLRCKVCTKFVAKIEGRRNYWVVGTGSVRSV